MAGARGRRPAGGDSRGEIVMAARQQFAEQGYHRASMRAIAQQAGVDPRLVLHYFGSKQGLFVAAVELPFDPATVIDSLDLGDGAGVGLRVAQFVVGLLESPASRATVMGIIRVAASEEDAAAMIRDFITERMLLPLAQRVSSDRPELRAGLLGSQVVGLVMARHVVGVRPLAQASPSELITALAPVFQHYLTGDLGAPPAEGAPRGR